MDYQSKRKWTVFFLIKSIDGSIGDAIEMINAIRRDVEACDYISIIFCLQVLKKNIPALESGDPDLIIQDDDTARTTVFYSLIKSNGGNDRIKSDLKLIAERIDFDITNPVCVGDFFKNIILKANEAERYILFTWDHGNGYGIFRDTGEEPPPQPDGAIELRPVSKMNSPTPLLVSNNIKNKTAIVQDKVLTMDELAIAIERAFGKKIDLVVMINCYMQFFDAGYALRNHVRYLVAPESYVYFEGYNYEFIFRKLAQEPSLSTKKLAKLIVNSFEIKMYDDPLIALKAKATTALFANEVTYYTQMAEYIDQLAWALEKKLIASKPEIIMARVSTPPVSGAGHLVDFFYLLQNLQKSLGKNWQQELVRKMLLLKKKTVVAQYIGFDFTNNLGSANPSGFSVYFPIKLIDQVASPETFDFFDNTSFKHDKAWHTLVDKFK